MPTPLLLLQTQMSKHALPSKNNHIEKLKALLSATALFEVYTVYLIEALRETAFTCVISGP